jgi:hypothetical protein
VLERLRPRLRTFRDERGRELFDVPDAPLPDPGTPAPVRFLPVYDNIVLSHADRTRIVHPFDPKSLGYREGVNFSSVLIDGFVGATWTVKREPRVATMRIALIDKLRKRERVAIEEEGARLLAFIASDAGSRNLVVSDPARNVR